MSSDDDKHEKTPVFAGPSRGVVGTISKMYVDQALLYSHFGMSLPGVPDFHNTEESMNEVELTLLVQRALEDDHDALQNDLDELVCQAKSEEASSINNEGASSQLDYLLSSGMTIESIYSELHLERYSVLGDPQPLTYAGGNHIGADFPSSDDAEDE